jgi:4-hydroxy-3-polyprenylbenzoate decarboxylase
MTSDGGYPGGAAARRILVAITGATGAAFGVRLLERLSDFPVEKHLILTPWGARTLEHETTFTKREVQALADVVHSPANQAATVSSGSFHIDGMAVVPCSVKTLASIWAGLGQDLVARAADVTIKERRRLVLAVREAPLSAIHLRNMHELAQLGVIIMPPVPAFYHRPQTIDDILDQFASRVLDQLGLVDNDVRRWNGEMGCSSDGARVDHRSQAGTTESRPIP